MLNVAPRESTEPIPLQAKYLPPRFAALIRAAADVFHLEPADVLEHTRLKSRADARHIVAWAIRKTWAPRPSFPEIGRLLGGYDHTTIMSAVRRIDREIARGTELGQLALRFTAPAPVLQLVPRAGQLEFEFEDVRGIE